MAVERKKPELLAPAGDMEKLRMAVLYGADAVYLGGTSFGMRAFAGNFAPEELEEAVAFAHSRGVRVHVTVNTMPRNGEADRLPACLEELEAAGVDALIVADLGPSPWRGGTPPAASATSAPRPASATTPPPGPGSTWGPAESSWPGSSPWRRSAPSGPKPRRSWSWRPLSTGPCA